MVSCLMLPLLSHFEFIFAYGVRVCSNFIDLHALFKFANKTCLYIFEINPLSVASFAIIFSQSEGCLFTLLIVYFAVQKLLSFIRSHLFIFAFVSNILGCGS